MKIFIAVGTQLAFDRMIRIVDEWAEGRDDVDVFAQSGPAEYKPKHMHSESFVPPHVFEQKAKDADLLIGHAGTGTIFMALELLKPVIVMPRRAALGEHRNDHQLATAEKFQEIQGVTVAWTDDELRSILDQLEELEHPGDKFDPHARPELLRELSDFINDAPFPRKRDRVRKLLRSFRP